MTRPKWCIVQLNESIEFRLLINRGYIAINLDYVLNDVIKLLGQDSKYAKMNEYVFKKKVELVS